MTILKLTIFILWTLLVLTGMGYIIRRLYKGLKTFHGYKSDEMTGRILDTADSLGVNTQGVRKLIEVTIGEKIRDLGIIETRTYGRAEIKYSAHISKVGEEKKVVLIIHDDAMKPTLIDFSKDREEYHIPIGREAAHVLSNILEHDEEHFLRTAAECESRLEMKQMIEKDPVAKTKNTILRWFAFLPLKEFGRIEAIHKEVALTGRKRIQYLLDIGAYIGKESDEIILVLRFDMKYSETGAPGRLHHILYYPFGAQGRDNLRKVLAGKSIA